MLTVFLGVTAPYVSGLCCQSPGETCLFHLHFQRDWREKSSLCRHTIHRTYRKERRGNPHSRPMELRSDKFDTWVISEPQIDLHPLAFFFLQNYTNDGICTCEIKCRFAMAKAAFNKKRAVFTSTLDL